MNVERMMRLATFLETKAFHPSERFCYSFWGGDNICGTTACAGGWATTIPEFRAAGLRRYDEVEKDCNGNRYYLPSFNGRMGQYAMAEFLEIIHDQANYLFVDQNYPPEENYNPKFVAARIRKLVCEYQATQVVKEVPTAVIVKENTHLLVPVS